MMIDFLPLITRLLCWPLVLLACVATIKLIALKRGGY